MNVEDLKLNMPVKVVAGEDASGRHRSAYVGTLAQPHGTAKLVTEDGRICVRHRGGVSYVPVAEVEPR